MNGEAMVCRLDLPKTRVQEGAVVNTRRNMKALDEVRQLRAELISA